MAIFDQGHLQNYGTMNNSVNYGVATGAQDVASQLKNLAAAVDQAITARHLDGEVANEVRYRVNKAVEKAKAPQPDKEGMLHALGEAKNLLEKIPAAAGALSGLVAAVSQVAQQVQLHF